MTIFEIRIAKDVLRNDGFGREIMEVARQLKVEVQYFVEVSNKEVNGKRWQSAMIDEREDAAKEEGGMWIYGRNEG